MPEARETEAKGNRWDSNTRKSFCTANETVNKMNKRAYKWEKIFADYVSDKG